MSANNTAAQYGWVAIALHWFAALALVVQIVIAWQAEALGEAGDRAGRTAMMGLHFSFGMTIALLLLARIAAHYLMAQPAPVAQPRPLQILAKAAHHLLLLAVLIMVISGPLQVLANARDISVWGAFTISSPLAEPNEAVAGVARTMHGVGRAMLYVLVPLHILGALKHWVLDRAGPRMVLR